MICARCGTRPVVDTLFDPLGLSRSHKQLQSVFGPSHIPPMSIYSWLMRYNDAKCDRAHRWIEGQSDLMAARVTPHVALGRGMSLELSLKEAFSTA